MSGKSAIKLAVILAGILLLLGGVSFLRCATRNPLFLYNRELEQNENPFRYFFKDRVEFCWNFLFQPKSPKGEDKSVAIPIMGPQKAFRLPIGTLRPGDYNSNPPTSGWNWPIEGKYASWKTPRRKFYTDSIRPEIAVTKLYVGFVWITYRSGEISKETIDRHRSFGVSEDEIQAAIDRSRGLKGIHQDVVEALKKIAANTPLVIVNGRYSNNGNDIALSAIGRQDKFNLENEQLTQEHINRIWDFILRYRNQPQEPGLAPMDELPENEEPAETLTPDEFDENL